MESSLSNFFAAPAEDLATHLERSTHLGLTGLASLLTPDALAQFLKAATRTLQAEPTLVKLNPTAALTVVGDLHGQFHDLLNILTSYGPPAQNSWFVFNGDFVDRGAWGMETLLLLLAWKQQQPKFVHLVRGNHESGLCTKIYGFLGELKAKFPGHHRKLYQHFKKLFAALPLAVLVDGATLVLHGGLFRKGRRRSGKLNRKGGMVGKRKRGTEMELGSLEDLEESSKGGPDPSGVLVGDVLWSDPMPEEGIEENHARGVGITFGPGSTQKFLEENGLKLVIRSHEGPDARCQRDNLPDLMKGYSTDHEVACGKLMTVFSAPDYPQYQEEGIRVGNKGAVLVLTAPDFATPRAECFDAAPRPDGGGPFYDAGVPLSSDVDCVDGLRPSGAEPNTSDQPVDLEPEKVG